jgi:hypothetical protein
MYQNRQNREIKKKIFVRRNKKGHQDEALLRNVEMVSIFTEPN